MAIQSPNQLSLQRKIISSIITLVIIFMAAANGIFTYFGAYLYLNEMLYAALFAVAVQFSIAATLITFPFVHGLGKISLMIVYSAALVLSTLSAYTYIYNSSLPENTTAHALDTELKARISNDLSDVMRAETQETGRVKVAVQELARLVAEEEARGGRSGLGPGKGNAYYEKLDQYEQANADYQILLQNFQKAQLHLNTINQVLSNRSSDVDREKLLVEFSGLRANVNAQKSQTIIANINNNYLGNLQNPVERAISALMDKNTYSIQLIVSVIWAAVFDIIALFLGIVRYYLLRPHYSVLQSFYDKLINFFMFTTRVRHMPAEVKMRFHKETGMNKYENDIPLNSTEMQTFATMLLAGSQMAQPIDDDSSEPIKKLLSYITPIDVKDDEQAVGIPFEIIDEEPRLKMLLAMLVQNHVFLKQPDNTHYILNSDKKLSQKIMVMIRMGMKDDPKESGIVSFLMDDPHANKSSSSVDDKLDLYSQSSPLENAPTTAVPSNSKSSRWGNIRTNSNKGV